MNSYDGKLYTAAANMKNSQGMQDDSKNTKPS